MTPFIDPIKAILQKEPEGTLELVIAAIDPPKNGTKKDGTPFTFYKYTFSVRATGETLTRNMFENDRKFILNALPGTLLRAKLNAQGFVNWSVIPAGEEAMGIENTPNTQGVKMERQLSASVQNDREEKELQSYHIGIRGILQSYIASGTDQSTARKKTLEDDEWVRSLKKPTPTTNVQ